MSSIRGSEHDCDYDEKEDIDSLLKNVDQLSKMFHLHHKIGEGTFSTVYLASYKGGDANKHFAIKHIVPTSNPERIKFELKCLKEIGGKDNVAGVDLCLRHHNDVLLIMPYQEHQSFSDYVGEMDSSETALYMKNLLIAVARVHQFGIIHRDIKPSNFLYDRRNKTYLLVDFGLAQTVPEPSKSTKRKRDASSPQLVKCPFAENGQGNKTDFRECSQKRFKENNPSNTNASSVNKKSSNPCRCYGKPKSCPVCLTKKNLHASRAGTPGFRPPEVLFKSTYQTPAVDVWATGVIFLCILSNTCTFFVSTDDLSALAELINVFGSEAIRKVAVNCGRNFICSEDKKGVDLRKMCSMLRCRKSKQTTKVTEMCCENCSCAPCICVGSADIDLKDKFPSEAYDLLKQLLNVNPNTRITAEEALKHPFLQTVY